MQWLCVIIAAIISSSEAINSKGKPAFILAVTAVTAAYATAAVDPLLGKWECFYCDSSHDIMSMPAQEKPSPFRLFYPDLHSISNTISLSIEVCRRVKFFNTISTHFW